MRIGRERTRDVPNLAWPRPSEEPRPLARGLVTLGVVVVGPAWLARAKVCVIFVGVDPGTHGGLAVLTTTTALAYPMPMLLTGRGERKVYDEGAIATMLRPLADRDVLVTIEKLEGIAGMRSAQAVLWATAGPMLFLGMSAAFGFRRQFVGPKRWQRELLTALPPPPKRERVDKSKLSRKQLKELARSRSAAHDERRKLIKAASVQRARQLFPATNLYPTPRSTTPSDGMAEALLIAEWGRRQHAGGALFAERSA